MKQSILAARRMRAQPRATFWVRNRPVQAGNKTLAQRYGDGRRIAAQPFQRSVADGTQLAGAGAISSAEILTLAPPPFAVRMLRNLSFGPTPATIAEFNALGSTDVQRLANWVDWQLDWRNIDDGALDARIAAQDYTTLAKSVPQLWADHVVPNPDWLVRLRPAFEIQRLQWVRATYSRRQLREMVVAFWHNHFHVQGTHWSAGPLFVHYDRDVIRPNALGNFRTMLEAVASSPSMLYYLNNNSNTRNGPNENYARELMELHTLGAMHYFGFADPATLPRDPMDANVPAGYTDIDVYEVARAFTGWTVRDGHWQFPAENDGTFTYRHTWHDTNAKTVLGMSLPANQTAMKDGRDVLDRLASHPATARFVCTKLIRRFVTDAPPASLVASAAQVFRQNWQAPNQIELVLRHILNSTAMFNTWGQKVRRPFDSLVAAMRAGGSDWTLRMGADGDTSSHFAWLAGLTGHTPFNWAPPNGYPDVAGAWSGSSAIAMTWKMLNWLTEASDNGSALLPVVALTRANVPTWTANALVDYWCMRLLGYLPAPERRQTLAKFMAQNGDPATYVITDTDAWAGNDLKRHYNHQRLRSMVSLIMLSPEFMSR
ncbi:DUF1800 domain-containing protein [Lysobacter sp. N42]|uniref:DUF1800 domain-containing protein n=1 Tax=Lysobacter sp. N42 TaxID=2545719 RepID=UPI00104C9E47|nr:DUF1800 domain-containing protein [Lysobacter sp. N42]TCZ86515.1 DUF1800 domain-containing protein [Lysobacter sp. N42]